MNKTFRGIGEDDRLKDSESRISQEKLNSTSPLLAVARTLLPFALLICILVSVLENPWLNPLIRAALFFVGIIGLILVARRFDRATQGHLVSLHGAVFSRLVYFLAGPFFVYLLFKAPYGIGYIFLSVWVICGLSNYFRWRFDSKNSVESGHASVLVWVRNIVEAIWLQFDLLLASIVRLFKLFLYSTVFILVGIYLMCRRIFVDPDPGRSRLTTTDPGMKSTLSVAHLSDLHFMGADAKLGLEGQSRNSELEGFLSGNKEELLSANLIAITGDITDTGFLDEWRFADNVLGNTLRDANKRPVVAMVPGNHDINVHLSFDKDVQDLRLAEKKLAWFGLGMFSLREVRLVRYLAFWDKWSSEKATVVTRDNKTVTGRVLLNSNCKLLNEFVDSDLPGKSRAREVEEVFNSTFPSVIKLEEARVCVYSINSNAATWHIFANSIGWFGVSQLIRLSKLLRHHPCGMGAIFLMHHHLKPGTRNLSHKSPDWRKRSEELFMITADAFLFRFILRYQLKKSALVLHGHTHYERAYNIGLHLALCAPSTGYGEESSKERSCLAYVHDLHVDSSGNISLINSKKLAA
jgi:predicted MPP superfamily phosphohydrolase